MGYGENCAVPKLGTNRLLDEVIRFHVNGRSGFIQHKNLCLAQKSSGQADQLTLPNTGGGGGGGGRGGGGGEGGEGERGGGGRGRGIIARTSNPSPLYHFLFSVLGMGLFIASFCSPPMETHLKFSHSPSTFGDPTSSSTPNPHWGSLPQVLPPSPHWGPTSSSLPPRSLRSPASL